MAWCQKWDVRSGYRKVKLNRASSLLTTFNTPLGRYCYNRLSFGLSSAQEVFQERVDEIFGDVPACTGIADDRIIAGWEEDNSDHDATLKTMSNTYSQRPEKVVKIPT